MTVLSIPNRALARVAARRRVLVRPTTELTSMTRYRGGTFSHTVERIVFTDGTSARTDLIRLNPNVHAYSLDFTGIAPQHPSRYRLATWEALPQPSSGEAGVDWILRHSYPMRSTAVLSQQLRQAGYPLGKANISEHEAIAATQAAIWHLTNGLALDTRPLNVPTAVRRGPGPVTTFEFDGDPQLGGYSVWSTGGAPIAMKLQKSANGVDWQDVSGSQLTTDVHSGRYQRTLGLGSTLAASSHGRGVRGYPYYRLIITPDSEDREGRETAGIAHVSFWLTGTRHYRNADRIVHLYNYLLAGARKALRHNDESALVTARAAAEADLVGPFQVRIPLSLKTADGDHPIDADGLPIDGVISPRRDFYLRRPAGASAITLTATTPAAFPGRVLTGVAVDDPTHRLTPVALAIPTDMAIEFDIRWEAHVEANSTEFFGEARIAGKGCR